MMTYINVVGIGQDISENLLTLI